jgi:acetyl esterase/lipase/lysophospholipase L1-like esterase
MKLRSLIIQIACVLVGLTSTIAAQTSSSNSQPTLYIIGDSTVKNSADGQLGWGDPIRDFFDVTRIRVENRARGGRSSRTFQTEGLWDQVIAELKPGDFVLMQFGHNDGGPINDESRARGSLPGLGNEFEPIENQVTKKTESVHTFGWYMRKFVADTKAKGATPIVLSPVPRNIWIDGKVERMAPTYGGWAAAIAKAQNAFFIDLNEIVAVRYEAIGQETVGKDYFKGDHTHTSPIGARLNAESVVAGMKTLKTLSLNNYLRAVPNTTTTTQVTKSESPTAETQTAEAIKLWPNGAPGALGSSPDDIPTLTPFIPKDKANGSAVIVCPGGGYQHLADHEGRPVAEWLNSIGITAFVLKYRIGPKYHHPAPLQDAARAVRLVRARAAEWKIDPKRIAVLGFSAGGHVASSIGTHFDSGQPGAADVIDRVSSRPDLLVLIYPVITMGEFTHGGSKKQLLGDNPTADMVKLMSNEEQVTKETPPTFLVHTANDAAVPVENSLRFAEALRKVGVPFELHIYERGKHGFGLAPDDPILSTWPARAADWLHLQGF